MGDVGSLLFGKTDPARNMQLPTMTDGQSALLKQLNELVSGQIGKGIEAYGGTRTAGASPLQTQSWDMLSKILEDTDPHGSKAVIDRIMGGSSEPTGVQAQGYDVGEFDPSATNQWYENALVNPAMDMWEKRIAPVVQEKFIGQNAGSSTSANNAMASSAADLMSGLNAQLADKLFGERQAHAGREFTAGMDQVGRQYDADNTIAQILNNNEQADLNRLLHIPTLKSQGNADIMNLLNMGTNAGGQQRGIEQEAIGGEHEQWAQSQGYNNPWLQLLAPLLNARQSENVVQPATQQEGIAPSLLALLPFL